MRLNRLFVLFVVMGVMLNISYGQTLYAKDASSIDIILESIKPDNIKAGDVVTLKLRVVNNGNKVGIINGLSLELPKQMKLLSYDTALDESYYLCGGCSKTYVLYVKVDPKTLAGKYSFNVVVKEKNLAIKKTYAFMVRSNPIIDLYTDVKDAYPNREVPLILTVKNEGKGPAYNIHIVFNSEKFILKGENSIFIETLNPNDYVNKTLLLYVDETVEPNSYVIPVKVEYEDSDHNTYLKNYQIGVVVKSNTSLSFSTININPAIIREGDEGSIIVRIENNGEGTARNVEVDVEGDDKTAFTFTKNYIGSLEEDEDSTATFSFKALKSGKSSIKVIVRYEDDTGKKEISTIYYINIASKERSTGKYIVLGIIVLAILVYYLKDRLFKR